MHERKGMARLARKINAYKNTSSATDSFWPRVCKNTEIATGLKALPLIAFVFIL